MKRGLWLGLLVGSTSAGCGMPCLVDAELAADQNAGGHHERQDATRTFQPSEPMETSHLPSAESFYSDLGDGTVIDLRNGLQWQRVVDARRYDWKEANAYCAELSLSGDGWHLPTKAELESIIDDTTFEPAVDLHAFPDTPIDIFWSSSSRGASAAWSINENGHSIASDVTSAAHVRCVRGELPTITVNRYAVSDAGTVHDTITGLTWQATMADAVFNHDAAIEHCAALSLEGDGWRLPTRAELLTLAEDSRMLPAIDASIFIDTPVTWFLWSSTGYAAASHNAWIVYFDIGKSNYTDVTASGYVRCVR